MSANALNYVLYQAGWFGTIGAALLGWPAVATGVSAALAAVHLWLAHDSRTELRLVLLGGAIGLAVDSVQIAAELLAFPAGTAAAWLCPPWIVTLWMQFATTFRYSLRRLLSSPARAAIFGALGGPVGYLGGERLGLVRLHDPLVLTLGVMAALWLAAVLLLARGVAASPPGRYRPMVMAPGSSEVGTGQPSSASEPE